MTPEEEKVHLGSLGSAEICYGAHLKEEAAVVEKTNLPWGKLVTL
jgi:hypothetical protein